MTLPFPAAAEPGIAPMEARLVDALPDQEGWRFEPKWDGFRCIAYRDGDRATLRSKSGKSLDRFFPEVVTAVAQAPRHRFIVDGELTIAQGDHLSFAALQARLHPAESRIRKLAIETPARMMLFDCLWAERDLLDLPFDARRQALEQLHIAIDAAGFDLSPITQDRATAARWLALSGDALDGVVAKRDALAYRPGERAMAKVKQHRTADCVIGGFRLASGRPEEIGSLLLGLYDEAGLLDHVGFTSSFDAAERRALFSALQPLIGPPGFTGDAPGGQSRWSTERSAAWTPLRPERIAEVCYDQVTGSRFRHGARFLRWRPDKAPAQCRKDQLAAELRPEALAELLRR